MISFPIVNTPVAGGNPYGSPVAAFSPGDITISGYSTLFFEDHSSGFPTSWDWQINGVTFATTQNPSYYFTTPGFFPITLTVTNAYGSNETGHTVQVVP